MRKVKQQSNTYAVSVVNNNNLHKRMIHYMIIAFFGFAFLYILVLVNLVWNIVERKSLEADARNLSSEVANLELSYLSLADTVDVDMSKTMGFHEVVPMFATSKSLGSLAKTTNEI
jgi:hypothetical protein